MVEAIYKVGEDYETADKYFIWARNGYVNDVDQLDQIVGILKGEHKDSEAEYIGFIRDDIAAEATFKTKGNKLKGDRFVSVNQIKIDYIDYGGRGGSEDKVYFEDDNRKIEIGSLFENGRVTVCVNINDNEYGYGSQIFTLPWTNFKQLSQKDFEGYVNETIFFTNFVTYNEDEDDSDDLDDQE